jgi:hypothetical protein
MALLFDACSTLISLIFLSIVGLVAGVAIPGLFMAAAAPWLDWLLPARSERPRASRDQAR